MTNHEINITERKRVEVTNVISLESFDSEGIFVNLEEDSVYITGENLHVEELDLSAGIMVASGDIGAVSYEKRKVKSRLFDRFRRKE